MKRLIPLIVLLCKIDSVSAKTIFNSSILRIGDLKKPLPAGGDPYLNTLQHTLKFLDQYNSVSKALLAGSMQSMQGLENKFQEDTTLKY